MFQFSRLVTVLRINRHIYATKVCINLLSRRLKIVDPNDLQEQLYSYVLHFVQSL